MRAVVTKQAGGPDVLAIAEIPTPTPGAGELLIKVVAAGVNRADVLQREGHYPPPPGVSDTIGLEVSGHVESMGDGVTGWQVGDPCVALLAGGGYAEYVAVDAGQVIPPPVGVGLVEAGGIMEVAATVVSNMDAVGLSPGETLLVHGGAGGIGMFAIQYAKALGCRVATTAGSPLKLALVRELGADITLDYHEDWVAALKASTDGHGADVILDIMGAKYLHSNVRSLARLGRLVIIGLQGGVKGELNINALLTKCASVTATSLRFRPVAEKRDIVKQVASKVWPLISTGAIEVHHQTQFAFEDVRAAHERLTGGSSIGKIVLTFGASG